MDNLRNAIEILFLKQDPETLLRECHSWKNRKCAIGKERFKQDFLSVHGSYSGNQAEQIYHILTDNWMRGEGNMNSVFNVLLEFGKKILHVKDGSPICKYEQYLRWHELTTLVGEDILTCSYLADQEKNSYDKRRNFAWDLVLQSDNTQLEALFQRGLTELHCHLNGSSINFDANWLAVMNEPLYQKVSLYGELEGEQLYKLALLAAYIRMYLFLIVEGNKSSNIFVTKFEKIWSSNSPLLLLDFYLRDLQSEVSAQAMLNGYRFDGKIIDYAIPRLISKQDEDSSVSRFIIGERRLMYHCFKKIFSGDGSFDGISMMLYIYLIIKNKVKCKFVQNNGLKGFENFQSFDKQKDKFVENARNTAYQNLIPQAAIQLNQKNSHIGYFELRIAPKLKASEIYSKLGNFSKWMGGEIPRCVMHFIKKPDRDKCFENNFVNSMICRNSAVRQECEIAAKAIERLLYRNEHRIVGIDAANSEFGCRPEVFAKIYRRLQHFRRDTSLDMIMDNYRKDLGLTYHVGEDYYDVVDGLRAIEEAVLFLNLTDGARLGHAVALGIDVEKYYKERRNTIIIPKQDLLDNVAWMLAKMDEYGLQNVSGVREKLLTKFQELANDLYAGFRLEDYRVYHLSWLLRGDSPYHYQGAKVQTNKYEEDYALNKFDKRIESARMNDRAQMLYREYHFNPTSKSRGNQPIEYTLPLGLIKSIVAIQAEMRKDIAHRKIAIEVNPTSNLRICNIDTYDTHPILKFRNYALTVMDDTNDCPQISVSINTDDQGIFATSLEKEFTLMALAIEKMKTEEGKPIYQPNSVMAWLEDIRQQAEIQRFLRGHLPHYAHKENKFPCPFSGLLQ